MSDEAVLDRPDCCGGNGVSMHWNNGSVERFTNEGGQIMKDRAARVVRPVIVVAVLGIVLWANAGDLNPPAGPVSSTMKTLTQVEPRTAVETLPGSATALYVISQPGSYYLTSNITGVSGKNGIIITADNVTLDLNGFALLGVSGTLSGVQGSFVKGIAITKGTVTGWGNDGLELSNSVLTSIVSSIRSTHNGRYGFSVGSGYRIVECVASFNASGGFTGASGNGFIGCTAHNNPVGFTAVENNLLIDCIAAGNQGNGIYVRGGSIVNRCTASENTGTGITTYEDCIVSNCSSMENTGDGINTRGSVKSCVNCFGASCHSVLSRDSRFLL